MNKKRIGDILVDSQLITSEQLEQALKLQKETKKKIGDILIENGFINEQQLIEVLEFQLGIPQVSLHRYKIDQSLVQVIPDKVAIQNQVIPIKRDGHVLTVAMADPLDFFTIDELRMITGFNIKPVIAPKEELRKVINRHYGIQESVKQIMDTLPKTEMTDDQIQSEDSPVSRMVNQMVKNAVIQGASDIHFESVEDGFRLRVRVDGMMRTEQILSKDLQGVISARLKIMSKLDIAEKRLPQDGRFKMNIDNRTIDVRVSTLPTVNGEKVVLRILDLSQAIKKIEDLGFSENNATEFRKIYHQSYGLILISGPTGSGKTSTLYAALSELNNDDVNIITVEDPVEYQLKGINQVQVNEKIGLTFSRGLRSILRQDPNIIMVGEIRDLETAEMAVTSALTGHLVLSTIHTNDAISSITRLVDMGIEPFLIASSLSGVIAQRLVRKVCESCAEEYTPTTEEHMLLKEYHIDKPLLMKGKGCSKCNRTGYRGRLAINELLRLDEELKEMIVKRQPESAYRRHLSKKNYKTIIEDGMEKVKDGLTTISEVLRVTRNI